MIDESTSYLGLPLPHADNLLEEDVLRLREALSRLDVKSESVDRVVAAFDAALAGLQQGAGKAAWENVSGKPGAFTSGKENAAAIYILDSYAIL